MVWRWWLLIGVAKPKRGLAWLEEARTIGSQDDHDPFPGVSLLFQNTAPTRLWYFSLPSFTWYSNHPKVSIDACSLLHLVRLAIPWPIKSPYSLIACYSIQMKFPVWIACLAYLTILWNYLTHPINSFLPYSEDKPHTDPHTSSLRS